MSKPQPTLSEKYLEPVTFDPNDEEKEIQMSERRIYYGA